MAKIKGAEDIQRVDKLLPLLKGIGFTLNKNPVFSGSRMEIRYGEARVRLCLWQFNQTADVYTLTGGNPIVCLEYTEYGEWRITRVFMAEWLKDPYLGE